MAFVRAMATRVGATSSTSLVPRLAFGAMALLVLALIGRLAGGAPATAVLAPATLPSASSSAGDPAGAEDRDGAAAPTRETTAPGPPPSGPATEAAPVFVNMATEDQLRRLPGVGAKRASAILALRSKVGRFRRIEELMRVKGIGRNTIKKWRPLVRLDVPDGGG